MAKIFNPCTIIHRIDAIRRNVLIGHYGCLTEFARNLHCRLLEKLDAMRADLENEVPFWIELSASRHKSEADESLFEFYFMRPRFAQRWIDEGPHSVLDEISVLAYADGEVCPVTLNHTVVPASELEGLDEIFEVIKRDTGVSIIAARLTKRS